MANGQALPETTSNPLAGIAALLQTLGGTQQTTNAGDTGPLRNVLAQLQAQDPNALLQSVFQQAGGQIPGLQQAYANAIGARSGNNSAVQAALNQLLQQTSVAAQQQMANQAAQNLQTQQAAAANIANATRGTTVTAGTNMSQAAKLMAGLQLASMLFGGKKGEQSLAGKAFEGVKDMFGVTPTESVNQPLGAPANAAVTTAATPAPFSSFMYNPFSGESMAPMPSGGTAGDFPEFSFNPDFTFENLFSPSTPAMGSGLYGMDFSGGGVNFGAGSGLQDLFSPTFTSGGGSSSSGGFMDLDFDWF